MIVTEKDIKVMYGAMTICPIVIHFLWAIIRTGDVQNKATGRLSSSLLIALAILGSRQRRTTL
jgi:hypothetical protein